MELEKVVELVLLVPHLEILVDVWVQNIYIYI